MNSRPADPVQTAVMTRTIVLATLALLALAAPAVGGERLPSTPSVVMPLKAGSPLPASLPFVVGTRPFTVTPSGSIVPDPAPVFVPSHRRHHHRTTTFISSPTATQVVVVPQPAPPPPQVIYVVQPQCVTPGAWSYRWVPYTTTQQVWVPGSWAADGAWMDSHWEIRPYSSGYYEPFWVPGQAYPC